MDAAAEWQTIWPYAAVGVAVFVVAAILVVVYAAGRREGFGWANWLENTDRENYISGAPCYGGIKSSAGEDAAKAVARQLAILRGYGMYEGMAARPEHFSPDKPGSCTRLHDPAATIEAHALRVAAGY
jgi:hypothetical protein